MKRYFLYLLLFAMPLGGCQGCGGCAKDTTKTIAKKTVQATKGAVAGIEEGLEEGRKETKSTDGALVVSKLAELEQHADLSIESLVSLKEAKNFKLTFVIANKLERPLRLIGLSRSSALTALDKDGFALPSVKHNSDSITCPAKAKIRLTIDITTEGKPPATLRFLDKEYSLPAPTKKDLTKP